MLAIALHLLNLSQRLRSILPCFTIQLKSDRAEAKYPLSVFGASVCLALHAKNESEETASPMAFLNESTHPVLEIENILIVSTDGLKVGQIVQLL